MLRLLVDSDVFCKLTIGGLLQEAIAILGANLDDCGCLPALQHMLRRGKIRRIYGSACDELIELAARMAVDLHPSAEWLDRFAGINEIDVGEAQLLAATVEHDAILLLSGDKRALRAVSPILECVQKLAGRVVTLEAILLSLCERLGDETVRSCVQPLVPKDTMLQTCFSPSNRDIRAGLSSYLEALNREVAPLKLWVPFGART